LDFIEILIVYACTKENVVYPIFRSSRMALIKAQLAANGYPLAKAVTPSRVILEDPNR
jgi:hypothetical protein